MLSLLFRLLFLALRVLNLALLVYCVMSFVMPQSEWYGKLARFIDPILNPVRLRLWKWFPALRSVPVDVSPLALWLILDLAMGLLRGF